MSIDLAGKRLELLKETVRKISRVAILVDPSRPRSAEVKEIKDAGQGLGVQVQSLAVKVRYDFKDAFRFARKGRPHALLIFPAGRSTATRPLSTRSSAK